MKTLKDYIINFAGLELGSHNFEYFINKKFFENFETSEISESEINAIILLQKQHDMLFLEFEIDGFAKLICERCLESFNLEITTKHQLFVKFGNEFQEISDNMIILPNGEDQIDVSQYIFEFIHLCLPISKTHDVNKISNNQCDKKAIEKMSGYLTNKLNATKQEYIDPRWDALRKLK